MKKGSISVGTHSTSREGIMYETKFREGFLLKNANLIEGRTEDEKMYHSDSIFSTVDFDKSEEHPNKIGDIDARVVASQDFWLRSSLPTCRVDGGDFLISAGTHLFFEVTCAAGDSVINPKCAPEYIGDNNIGIAPHPKFPRPDVTHYSYIEKKARFHRKLVDGKGSGMEIPPNKHVWVLIFNGADSLLVAPEFKRCCKKYGLIGVSAYVSQDSMISWPATVEKEVAEFNIRKWKLNFARFAKEGGVADEDIFTQTGVDLGELRDWFGDDWYTNSN